MKKTVLMVHNFYKIGGGEHTVFKNELDMLRKNGHKVVTYTRSNGELDHSKMKLLILPFTTIWSWKTYREVKKIIKEENIEIVHCHNTFPLISPSVYYAARSLRIPIVQTIHNFRFLCPNGIFYRNNQICEECSQCNSFKSALKNKCYRNSFLQTSVVVAMLKIHRLLGTYKKISYIFLTDFNKKKFENLLGTENTNVFVKPNFVKEPEITAKKDAGNEQNVFVFAGRLETNKGIDFLIKAWEQMPLDYQLHIYGDGTLRTFVEQSAEKKSNILYRGFQEQKEIFEDVSTSKALLFPSRWYETFGMVVAESFSMGIPVVTTNIGNQKNIVENSKGGTVFDDNNYESFKNALKDVLDNHKKYAFNAKKYFDTYLSESHNYEILKKIYEEVRC